MKLTFPKTQLRAALLGSAGRIHLLSSDEALRRMNDAERAKRVARWMIQDASNRKLLAEQGLTPTGRTSSDYVPLQHQMRRASSDNAEPI